MDKTRETWVDIAKGIGIILVIIGHANCPNLPHGIIYSFHMPLFFFLSRLFISRQCENNFHIYLKKNFKSLLLPYFYFNIISIAFYYTMSIMFHKELLIGNVQDNLIGIFVGMRFGSPYHHVLWFLPCLFFAKMLAYPIFKLSKIQFGGGKFLLAIVTLTIGLTYCKWTKKPLPMSFDASLIAVFFIVCGDYYMKYQAIINKWIKKSGLLLILFSALFVFLNFDKVEMYNMSYGSWIPFVCGSLSSIFFICYLCKQTSCSNKFLRIIMEYGKLSLLVFATHFYFLFVPITLKNRLLPKSLLWQDYMYWIASILICLILVLPVSKFINNKAKWLAGK